MRTARTSERCGRCGRRRRHKAQGGRGTGRRRRGAPVTDRAGSAPVRARRGAGGGSIGGRRTATAACRPSRCRAVRPRGFVGTLLGVCGWAGARRRRGRMRAVAAAKTAGARRRRGPEAGGRRRDGQGHVGRTVPETSGAGTTGTFRSRTAAGSPTSARTPGNPAPVLRVTIAVPGAVAGSAAAPRVARRGLPEPVRPPHRSSASPRSSAARRRSCVVFEALRPAEALRRPEARLSGRVDGYGRRPCPARGRAATGPAGRRRWPAGSEPKAGWAGWAGWPANVAAGRSRTRAGSVGVLGGMAGAWWNARRATEFGSRSPWWTARAHSTPPARLAAGPPRGRDGHHAAGGSEAALRRGGLVRRRA